MKKLLVLLTLLLAFSFTACQSKDADKDPDNNNEQNSNLEDDLETILDKIYETAKISDTFKEYIETGLQTTEMVEGQTAYFLGKDDIEFESAIASEPIMSPSAYSLCLVRVKEGANIEELKSSIKENVDPMKWVCVGVDPKNIVVESIGDVIILIMSDNEATALQNAFLTLKK